MSTTAASPAKGGRLTGGALSDEALASSPSVLRPSRRPGQSVGLQQFFSPPEAAELVARVLGPEGSVLDPTAGAGDLMRGWPAHLRHGIELDPDHTRYAPYTALTGDLQALYPLLRLARLSFDCAVLNPPFGLEWTGPDGARLGSVRATLRFAIGLLVAAGQGALIAGRDRYWREVHLAPEAAGVWAVVGCPDLFPGVGLPSAIAFFVAPADRREGDALRLEASRAELAGLAAELVAARAARCGYLTPGDARPGQPEGEAFRLIQAEHAARLSERRRGLRGSGGWPWIRRCSSR